MKYVLISAICLSIGYVIRAVINIPNKGQYQLYLIDSSYVLKDGERVVWQGRFEDRSQIDSIVIADNL